MRREICLEKNSETHLRPAVYSTRDLRCPPRQRPTRPLALVQTRESLTLLNISQREVINRDFDLDLDLGTVHSPPGLRRLLVRDRLRRLLGGPSLRFLVVAIFIWSIGMTLVPASQLLLP